ncbi:MAG: Bacterial type secretion system protein domain protein [Nocardioides sp.]|uniref:type II secretion system F family protein n=1 Tax=Nocardioides sp. TaxID=35761 RepID=UPI002633BF3A|nr:type II secretion system F family protein [Nocardioides sp.]MCW2832351.1 Bacterial type secretion system protein domain protein [Nocardioides sp.]
MITLAAIAAGVAALLGLAPPRRLALEQSAPATPASRTGRWRPVLCLLAGAAAGVFVGGRVGLVIAPVAGATAWIILARSEPSAVRQEREAIRAELPHVVDLMSCALRSGASLPAALAAVVAACPGSTAQRLEAALARLRMGVDPLVVWGELAHDDVLAPMGRTLARVESSGAPVADEMERLADDLERSSLAAVEDRARSVGVKAAVPLGLCLLPAFLLIGIVPTVAGLLTSLVP